MALAAVIFIAAAAIAVVQATGSDDPAGAEVPGTGPVNSDSTAEPQQAQTAVEESDATVTDTADTEPTVSEQQEIQSQDPAPQEQEQALSETQSQDQAQPAQQAQTADTQSSQQSNPLLGFQRPIAGACITEHEGHLPNATRAYRNDGVHEGLDFYQWASCTVIDYATPILAAKAGVISRADLDYVDITPTDWERFQANNWEGEAILDELRGRQVWIDHGRGIVTRYAHLSAIADGIAEGVEVRQGQIIGYPGESGQQEVYQDAVDIHLHFEIRIADGWLGEGETPQQARKLYLEAFGLGEE